MNKELTDKIRQAVLLNDPQELYLIFLELGLKNVSMHHIYNLFYEATGVDYCTFNYLLNSIQGVNYYECVTK